MLRIDRQLTSTFILVGATSGLACLFAASWVRGGILGDALPGIIYGGAVYVAGTLADITPPTRKYSGLLMLVIASVVGWIYAPKVGIRFFWYTGAGGFGALIVSLAMLWAWRIEDRKVIFISAVTAAGLSGGLIFHLITGLPVKINDVVLGGILFVEWQAFVLGGAAIALTNSGKSERKTKINNAHHSDASRRRA